MKKVKQNLLVNICITNLLMTNWFPGDWNNLNLIWRVPICKFRLWMCKIDNCSHKNIAIDYKLSKVKDCVGWPAGELRGAEDGKAWNVKCCDRVAGREISPQTVSIHNLLLEIPNLVQSPEEYGKYWQNRQNNDQRVWIAAQKMFKIKFSFNVGLSLEVTWPTPHYTLNSGYYAKPAKQLRVG